MGFRSQPVDPQSVEPKGDLFPVAERISRGQGNGNYLFSVAANGFLFFQSGGSAGGNQQVWFDRTGKESGTVGGTVPSRYSIALSPEGKRVAIERISDLGNSDLWITDMEHRGTETRLTFDPSINREPVWSPDGIGQDERLFESKETKMAEDWSRDGKELFYMAPDRKLMAVEIKAGAQSFDCGAPQALFESRSSVPPVGVIQFGYAVSADGKRFLMPVAAGSQAEAPPLTVVVNWLAWVKK